MVDHIKIYDTVPRVDYPVGSSATAGPFAVPFVFFAYSDLKVYVNGVLKTLDVDYGALGAGSQDGGSVTLYAPVANSTVRIERVLPLARTTDFPESSQFPIRALNTDLDRMVCMIQQAQLGATDSTSLEGRLAAAEASIDVAEAEIDNLYGANDTQATAIAANAAAVVAEAGFRIANDNQIKNSFKAGTVDITFDGSGTGVYIAFAAAFGGVPVVMVQNASGDVASAARLVTWAVTGAGFTVNAKNIANGNYTGPVTVQWMAFYQGW